MTSYVVTVTPNPALDMGGEVASLIPNEKSYVLNPSRHPGGNAINAGRILSRLQTPVVCTGFLGGNTGQEIQSLLKKEHVGVHFIQIAQTTRMNITVSNQKDHNQTRLTFPGPAITRKEKQKLIRYLKGQNKMSHLVIGGSFPEGFTVLDVIRIAKLARKLKVPTIIDCPGKLLHQLLPARPLLIKPNLIEFQELVGKKVTSLSAILAEARKLLSHVSLVCVSSVKGGTLLVTNEGCFFGKIARVKIRSTVGAGDSMVGAIVSQLHQGNADPQDLLRWGLAASAATLSTTGTTLGSANEIKRLYKKTSVARLP
jgi:6-phosphofructokinase 2